LLLTQAAIGALIFPETPAETAAGAAPSSFAYDSWRGDDIRRFGAIGDGVTDNSASLNTANSVGTSLYIPPGTYLVNSNLTLSVPLIFDYGAILKPANGVTITINAQVLAGQWQIFNTTAGGRIAGRMKAPLYFVEWWGAAGNGRKGNNGSLATVGTAFTDASATFTAADVGKDIFIVPPANSALAPVLTTIAAFVSVTSVTLASAASWASYASFTATCSSTTLNVSAITAGTTIFAGQTIKSGAATGTVINYQISGTTGGVGTYNVSISQTISGATAMTSSSPLSYYYGTDDTAAINAANGGVGTIIAGEGYSGDQGSTGVELTFAGGAIYMLSGNVVIGNVGVTAGQWRASGGVSAALIFGISSTGVNCITFGQANSYVGATAAMENFFIDACYSGQDIIQVAGFQSPHMRNMVLQNSARDCMSFTPPAGSFLQQCDFQNMYLGPAGRHNIYINPAAGSFANETDFLNLVMQYPSTRQAGGTAIYVDTTTGGLESWNITNYKASTGWNGDANYQPMGSFFYINSGNGVWPEVGITFTNGYCENGTTANPIGATTAPFKCAAGSYAMIRVRGFYSSYWGSGIGHADHDAASQFTVAATSGTQQLMTSQPYYSSIVEWVINVSDGTNSDYYRFQSVGGKGYAGHIDNIGTKLTVGTSPTYTVTATNVSSAFGVLFSNTGSVALTVSYGARILDCGSAPIFYY
jgi:hypothetical protein